MGILSVTGAIPTEEVALRSEDCCCCWLSLCICPPSCSSPCMACWKWLTLPRASGTICGRSRSDCSNRLCWDVVTATWDKLWVEGCSVEKDLGVLLASRLAWASSAPRWPRKPVGPLGVLGGALPTHQGRWSSHWGGHIWSPGPSSGPSSARGTRRQSCKVLLECWEPEASHVRKDWGSWVWTAQSREGILSLCVSIWRWVSGRWWGPTVLGDARRWD